MNEKPTITSSSMESPRLVHTRIVQNFHLVWLDKSIDETNDKWRDSILQLHKVVNTITTFVDIDLCIDFITDSQETAFMIISGEFNPTLISIVLEIVQVSDVYILCEKWSKNCPQVSGVYTDITSLCEVLKHVAQDHDHNMLPISLVKKTDGTTNENLDRLDCSFMYTRMLKEILLTIDFDLKHFQEFLTYCREQLAANPTELKNVDKIEGEYTCRPAVWWYTYQCFLYSMLNRALRTMETDLIINMGFFVRDLHNHIATLHTEQYNESSLAKSFVVYRGQGLSQNDFDKLKTTEDGLLAFNNFLSTSLHREVSLKFARRTIKQSNLVGILFIIKIDPLISTTPFANIKNVSCYKREEEILFSMHSVFRIGSVEQIENNDRLWQVNLTLTSDTDPQLQMLAKSIENDMAGLTTWFRLGRLLVNIAEFDKAQQVYDVILKQTTDEREKGHIYHHVGLIKDDQGKHMEALAYYEKALEIRQKTLPANHPDLALPHNNISAVYTHMGEYTKALLHARKSLEILQKALPANHSDLATSYNNIGEVHRNIGEHSTAISYLKKALEICQATLSSNHPDLAISYNNIGGIYDYMGEYSVALSYYEKALAIIQEALPAKHPRLAISYNNVAAMYEYMGEHLKALSYYEKALEILQKALLSEHPNSATLYSNIGEIYSHMGQYSSALSYHEKALDIRRKTLPASHPDLAASYHNIGRVHSCTGEYSKALSYYASALKIQQKVLPVNHPDLATCHNNIGTVYYETGEYSKALSYYEQALEIRQKTLRADHLDLANSYSGIGAVYQKTNECSKALLYHEKALKIRQQSLPPDHPDLTASYNNIGAGYKNIGDYSKALSYYEQALEIQQKALPLSHPNLAVLHHNIGSLYESTGQYSKAFPYYTRALEIAQNALPANHTQLEKIKKRIDLIKNRL